MEKYQSVLIKHIAFTGSILFVFIMACIVLIVVTKKFKLEKFNYFIAIALIFFSLLFAGKHLVDCSYDLYYESYEIYTGMCSCPTRDTLILYNEERTKLLSLVSSPAGENELCGIFKKIKSCLVCYRIN